MNLFEKSLCGFLGEAALEKIQSVRIGIAGAGGLGSNCAYHLVRCGFKNFFIVDFDQIQHSNLNRQFYFLHQVGQLKVAALRENLLQINPDLNIEICSEKIEQENIQQLFHPCDILVEAFDKAEYKKLIVEEYLHSNKFLVSGSGLAGYGNSDEIRIHQINPHFYMVGDLVSGVSEKLPPLSPKVNMVAAKQADLILEYVLQGSS